MGCLFIACYLISRRSDVLQSNKLAKWLGLLLDQYRVNILNFTPNEARVWGHLRKI